MITISDFEFWLPPHRTAVAADNLRQSQCTKIVTIEAVTPVTGLL
jgi:hypothetical protein